MRSDELRQKAKDKALKKAGAFQRLFKTPDGKVVLQELADEFGSTRINIPGDPFGTHVRVGNFEVLQFIYDIMEVDTDA